MAYHLWIKVGYDLMYYFVGDDSFDLFLRFLFSLIALNLSLCFRALSYRGQMMVFLLKYKIILKHYKGSFLFKVSKYLIISSKYFWLLCIIMISGLC